MICVANRIVNMAKKPQSIGNYVRAWREDNELSLRELAAKIKVSNVYVMHIENDKYDYPIEFVKSLYPLMTKKQREEIQSILVNRLLAELKG